MILRDAVSLKIHAYDICVSGLITFYIFDVNNDLSGVGINNSLVLPSVFVSVLFLRALDKSSLIKFTFISYVSFSILFQDF